MHPSTKNDTMIKEMYKKICIHIFCQGRNTHEENEKMVSIIKHPGNTNQRHFTHEYNRIKKNHSIKDWKNWRFVTDTLMWECKMLTHFEISLVVPQTNKHRV
jgi:hypothetical protein